MTIDVRCIFIFVCALLSTVLDWSLTCARVAWFTARGGAVRTFSTSTSLCAYDCLDSDRKVFKTLTRGLEEPRTTQDDLALRSKVLMITMFIEDSGMSCTKAQAFLHERMNGLSNTRPTASELARLVEAACRMAPLTLRDNVLVIFDDLEEALFAGDDIVVL